MNLPNNAIRLGLTMALVLGLQACGGGGGGGGGSNPPSSITPATQSGVLSDSPVGGVAYATSPSGLTGTTSATGVYNFRAGDTVEFRLGTLVLGNVTATGIVTPTELAAGNANKLSNLLVLLQSLDSDGDATNGITIPPLAAASVSSAIVLTVLPASLDTAAIQAAMTAGGIPTNQLVTQGEADAHYLAQGMVLLAGNVWATSAAGGALAAPPTMMFLRVADNGEYLQGEAWEEDTTGFSGVEHGTVELTAFDTRGYQFSTNTTLDTNGDVGMSRPGQDPCDRMRSQGDRLVAVFIEGEDTGDCTLSVEGTIQKAENNPSGIVGVWAVGSATTINTQHVAFFSNGKFLTIDPLGDPDCGGLGAGPPGVEAGSYTYDTASKILRSSNFVVDTNGCAGLSHGEASTPAGLLFTISPNGTTVVASGTGPNTILYRVPFAINMVGKSITSVITYSQCMAAPGYLTYTFTNTALTFTGQDSWHSGTNGGLCGLNPGITTDTLNMVSLPSDFDVPFNCASFPICTSADFNKTISGLDQDGRVFTSTSSYDIATGTLTYAKFLPNNGPTTFTEVMTIQ